MLWFPSVYLFLMVNEQSVGYWDAFQNSRVDHDKIIFFLWQSCHRWDDLLLCVNKDLQCGSNAVVTEHRLTCQGRRWICCKVLCRLALKINLSLLVIIIVINCSRTIVPHTRTLELKRCFHHLFVITFPCMSSFFVRLTAWPCQL